MNFLSRSRVSVLTASLWLASGACCITNAQQTTAAPQPVPVTNDTPAQTTRPETTPVPGSGAAVAPMSKSQLKAQKRQEKTEEKAADANAKAARSQAKAKKQTDKATQAEEKATQPH